MESIHSNQRDRSDDISPTLSVFPVCQRSSWNKQGEIEKSCQLELVTADKVAFLSLHY